MSCCFSFLSSGKTNGKTKAVELSGMSAIVTGSSEGMGVAMAHRLAAEGVTKIMLAALGMEKLEQVAADIRQKHPGTTVLAMETDVSDSSACEKLVEKVLEQFGSCDILLNNAGIGGVSEFKTSLRSIDPIIDINLKGSLYMACLVLPSMVQAGRGHIVNIGSISALRVEPLNTVYMASKSSIVSWSHGLRAEMQHYKTGVTVHVINPGIVRDGGLALKPPRSLPYFEPAIKKTGSTTVPEVVNAVVSAIKHDIPDIVVNNKKMKLNTYWPEVWQGPWVEWNEKKLEGWAAGEK